MYRVLSTTFLLQDVTTHKADCMWYSLSRRQSGWLFYEILATISGDIGVVIVLDRVLIFLLPNNRKPCDTIMDSIHKYGRLLFKDKLMPGDNRPRAVSWDGSLLTIITYARVTNYLVWELQHSVFALALVLGDGDLAVARKLLELLTPAICQRD